MTIRDAAQSMLSFLKVHFITLHQFKTGRCTVIYIQTHLKNDIWVRLRQDKMCPKSLRFTVLEKVYVLF